MIKKSYRDLYFVAVKVFLERGNKFLIFKDKFGDWDIPGGRLKKNEFHAPFEKVVKRKVREELGSLLKYRLGKPIVLMRHARKEVSRKGKPQVRIFAIGYDAEYAGGEVKLSKMHTEFRWVPVGLFHPEKFFAGGWLKGVKEYLAIKRKKRNT